MAASEHAHTTPSPFQSIYYYYDVSSVLITGGLIDIIYQRHAIYIRYVYTSICIYAVYMHTCVHIIARVHKFTHSQNECIT